ncbi:transporter substrate-binding domain-containing protein [Arthrobacter yangruifuii]|uniref:Transporter substrate-binding domain-containing protein n=1 Tax=Arthrobacter yangruifuii TaxID=2606616 RepID=A0A5N6MGM4_9MICC|nr:transporter substrate-binding domain-containing protein [Arthrobacter yangruifuii]KAD3455951.1 transporter substrate-binding domain-containing protein [Arthrobacter yangruifuii]
MTYRSVLAIGASATFAALALSSCSGQTNATSVADDCVPQSEVKTLQEGVLTVAAPEFPPFSSISDGEATGADADIIKQFAEDNCLEIRMEPTSYAGTIPAVQSKRADVAIGCYYRTAQRAEIVDLSAPVYTDDMGVVSTDGVTSIRAMEQLKVGTVDGYLWVADMKAVLGDKLTVYPSAVEMQADLKAGRIQVGLDGFGSAAQMYKDSPDYKVLVVEPDERVVASTEPAQIGFPHTKGNTSLTQALDASIESMKADDKIVEILTANGLPETAAETGEPRLIK